ncbi:MAG: MauE/DoxX family redox-associated membrane protein [Ferruginibacter sp.]
MTHTYNITGMTCGGCVAKAKSALLKLGDITEAEVQLSSPQATITMAKHIPVSLLQKALNNAGPYSITETNAVIHHSIDTPSESSSWLQTYKPILIIAAYITAISLLIETQTGFHLENWMQNFMAGFFIVFCFFKVLDLKGFADSYATYDIIAKRWHGWGYVYAFIELGLGIAYLLKLNPLFTNAITFVVMSVSLIGVLQAVLKKQKIRCACLGAVFNLPMSTVTILEDVIMIGMSLLMLLHQ